MARKKIDVRTKTMSPAAKKCRTIGAHAMDFVPVSPARRLELRQRGQYAERMVCLRGCSRWREQVFDADTDELVAQSGGYLDKDSYLVQARGTGRLPRAAARAAYHSSISDPELPPAVPLPEAWQTPLRRVRPEAVAVPAPPERAPRQRGSRRRVTAETP
jgi:hypothetical protein